MPRKTPDESPCSLRSLIRQRIANPSEPGGRADGATLGLCIEGGGMRGVVSAGMLVAFERFRLLQVFDAIYGVSSGLINGAYFAARQARFGVPIYYRLANTSHLFCFSCLPPRLELNLDYLVNSILRKERPLDLSSLEHCRIPVFGVFQDAVSAQRVVAQVSGRTEKVLAMLEASVAVPVVSGPPREIEGRALYDGAFVEPIPFESAIKTGCTHLVVLRTRTDGVKPQRHWLLDELLIMHGLRRMAPALVATAQRRVGEYARASALAMAGHSSEDLGIPALVIAPRQRPIVTFECRPARLVSAMRDGYRSARQAIVALVDSST